MARPNLCSNSVPRVELDHRARDARLRLVRIERLLVPRAAGNRFRLLRLFAWRVYREPRSDRTQGSMSRPRGGFYPGNRLGMRGLACRNVTAASG